MVGYKLMIPCLVSGVLAAASVQSQTLSPNAQLQTFAVCAGRLAAVIEHEWDQRGAVSQQSARQRDAVVGLVAAIAPVDQSRDILNWRNGAKYAQEQLLRRAVYAKDAQEAQWASARADALKQECTALLLG